jgi:CheY-like chemotaxis protein
MSLILVVESEGRHAERVRDGLGSDGWQVEVVASCEAAVAAVADRAPQLVLINAELPGAPEMLRSLSRAHGGPGSIALLPEVVGKDLGPLDADESLIKPFSEKDLRQLARRVVSSARPPRKNEAEADQKRLTSHELFGDLLAEVENEVAAPAKPAPTAPARAAAAPPAAASGRSLEVEQRLERTLSGMIKEERSAAPAPKKASTAIEDMLTATLSGLDMPKKSRPAAPAAASAHAASAVSATPATPAVPAVPAAPVAAAARLAPAAPAVAAPEVPPTAPATPAEPLAPLAPAMPATPAPMAVSAATAAIPIAALAAEPRVEPPPAVAAPPAPAPPAVVAPAAKIPDSTAAARRPSREIDLAQLDQLAKPRSKESTAARPAAPKETFATQKIPMQPSFLQAPSSEFGQYTLLERIAVGGMAEVWKARMKGVEGFQKTVAIKKILPHLTDSSDFVTMFIDEAKLAAQLNHNNIIHIYDLGKIGEDYFIAMEFVDGKDLRSILNSARAASRPCRSASRCSSDRDSPSALDYAHRRRTSTGARTRPRAPRRLAPERPDQLRRRHQAVRLRHRQGGHQGLQDPDGRAQGQSSSTCHPSRPGAARWTHAPTSSRSVRCCSRCSPAGDCLLRRERDVGARRRARGPHPGAAGPRSPAAARSQRPRPQGAGARS